MSAVSGRAFPISLPGKLLVPLLLMAAGYFLSSLSLYILSGTVILICGIAVSAYMFRERKVLVNPEAIFSFFWLCSVGLAAMKLSNLSSGWSLVSWLSFYFAYAFFVLGFELMAFAGRRAAEKAAAPAAASEEKVPATAADTSSVSSALLAAAGIIMAVSVVSLAIEAYLLGFVPLLTDDTPHAYSYFHISGLHYLTVSFVLVPALLVTVCSMRRSNTTAGRIYIAALILLSILLPILLVSRFELLFEVFLAAISFLILENPTTRGVPKKKYIPAGFAAALLLLFLYIFITIERAHSEEYLLSIFDMKYGIPVYIAQPYIYIANNFDNFNALTIGLSKFTHGLRMLFPVFALTGLKFIFPSLVDFPLYVTKEELTTVTLIYDFYYDFGIMGVIICMFLFGAFVSFIFRLMKKNPAGRPILTLFYAQIIFYISFSFFTTWFSNPAVWYYFLVTGAVGIYVSFLGKAKEYRKQKSGKPKNEKREHAGA